MPKTYFFVFFLGVLAALSIATVYWHGRAVEVQAQFDLFKTQTEDAGKQALSNKARQEQEWNEKLSQLETEHAKTTAVNHARFTAELTKLRAHNTGSGGMSETTERIDICADGAGNQRLSGALSQFREGLLHLLDACQRQTDTLIACQDYVKTITQ